LNAKYQPAWAGPYRIRAKVGLLNYRLVNRHTGKDLQASPHVQRLKPYHPRRPVDHPELSREAESFEWAQESYESRVTERSVDENPEGPLVPAPVDASTVPENAATAAESANITLDQTPLSQLFTTLHAAYHNLRKQNRPYTSKVWHSARDKILLVTLRPRHSLGRPPRSIPQGRDPGLRNGVRHRDLLSSFSSSEGAARRTPRSNARRHHAATKGKLKTRAPTLQQHASPFTSSASAPRGR